MIVDIAVYFHCNFCHKVLLIETRSILSKLIIISLGLIVPFELEAMCFKYYRLTLIKYIYNNIIFCHFYLLFITYVVDMILTLWVPWKTY